MSVYLASPHCGGGDDKMPVDKCKKSSTANLDLAISALACMPPFSKQARQQSRQQQQAESKQQPAL